MSQHPVRLLLSDDLERDRLTVFFRFILSIPHFIWITLWGIASLVLVIVSWVCTLIMGRSPRKLHELLASFVKYMVHFYGYLNLAANPYPRFDGRPGYPVDVEIPGPQPQNRLTVLVRGILLLPAFLIVTVLFGNLNTRFSVGRSALASYGTWSLLSVVAFLGWFAILARGRMPRGLRDAAAYGLSYGAQFYAYAFLLTQRYPDSDPLAAVPDLPAREDDPIRLRLDDHLRRSRLTVFFRFLLALPHLIWLELWGIVALVCAVLNWVATLFAGRSPEWLYRFLAAYLRYVNHVFSYLYLIANPFPGFTGKAGSYPFEIVIAPRERQNRWKTGFRIVLAIPALLLAGAYGTLAGVAAVLGWFSSLALGRMPPGLRNAGALALRYQAQAHGYLLLLTDAYPYSGPVRPGAGHEPALAAAPSEPGDAFTGLTTPDVGLS
ncbi:MAG TPA: DUF4389 domain-containing protein [Solirubrobacteraceae bacterium]|nr:DUF4389 domain-containing protein [Solirubrobacteraceae bacterium]